MHELVAKYAEDNNIEVPEDYKKIAGIMFSSDIPHFMLDFRRIGKHQFVDTQYQMLNPKHINSEALGDYEFNSTIARHSENVFTAVNSTFNYFIKEKWNIEKIMVIGIANKHGERDIGLFYIFDESGISEGLYTCSWDRIDLDGKQAVDKSLDDMFHIPETTDFVAEDKFNQRYRFKRKKQPITLESIITRAGDRIGFIDRYIGGVEGYKNLLELFRKLSSGEFSPTAVEVTENGNQISVRFSLGASQYQEDISPNNDVVYREFASLVSDAMHDAFDKIKYEPLIELLKKLAHGLIDPADVNIVDHGESASIHFTIEGAQHDIALSAQDNIGEKKALEVVRDALIDIQNNLPGSFSFFYHPDHPTQIGVMHHPRGDDVGSYMSKTGYVNSWIDD